MQFINHRQQQQISQLVEQYQQNTNGASFEQAIVACQTLINQALKILFNQNYPTDLFTALAYANNGGKRLRGFLVLTITQLLAGDLQQAIYPALAIEMLHTYSLVHDDLPDMDNDDLRRGQLSTHKKFNNSLAILVGDALQAQAYQTISFSTLTAETQLKQIVLLSQAAGAKGMVLGQAIDMNSNTVKYNLKQLTHMHSLKTGALIQAAVQLGYTSTNKQNPSLHKILDDLSQAIGIAYQVRDDILDVIGDPLISGKTSAKDIKLNKSTFVTILGLTESQHHLQKYLDQANNNLDFLAQDGTISSLQLTWLYSLVAKLATRDH